MARYRGPKTKISRKFGESIYGFDKYFERKKYPPGQHGNQRRRKVKSEYATQLMEKQKMKYTYGVLEKPFRNLMLKHQEKKVLPVKYYYSYWKQGLIMRYSGWVGLQPEGLQGKW